MALFDFLRPDQKRLDDLARRLASLEASEQAREVAFLDIAERVKRHLQRSAAIEQRTKDREEGKPGVPDPVTAAVLSLKFPPRAQGG